MVLYGLSIGNVRAQSPPLRTHMPSSIDAFDHGCTGTGEIDVEKVGAFSPRPFSISHQSLEF